MVMAACRYHISEIERLIKDSIIINDAQSLDELKHNYQLRTGGKGCRVAMTDMRNIYLGPK